MISKKDKMGDKIGYLFVSPAVFFIGLFFIITMGFSLYVSLYRYDILSPQHPFIGFSNYQRALWKDPLVGLVFKNTFYYLGVTVPLVLILSFFLALLTYKLGRSRGVFQTIFFIPSVTSLVVLSFVWMWIYSRDGIVNMFLDKIGLPTFNWLMDTRVAMPAVIIMSVWKMFGYYMIIFIAGLSEIPSTFYDAAKMDGANSIQCLWHITIPLLKNVSNFVVIMLIISCSQVFTQVYLMTEGGPANSTEVVLSYIYKHAFRFFHMGYGSALSWILFIIIVLPIMIYAKIFKSEQMY